MMKGHLVFALTMAALGGWAGANAKYSGGTGSPDDPYRVATAEDLNDIGNHEEDWGRYFVLIKDVNLAGYTGTQFSIIGNVTTPFTGVFDGNDHKVWSFAWDSTGRGCVGLFGCVGGPAGIKNLGMESVNVNAATGSCVGGLAGWNYHGEITHCYSTGSVSGGDWVGGVVGHNAHGMITDCHSSIVVSGRGKYAGGLVGENHKGQIESCYSKGSVDGNDYAGGLAGQSYEGMIIKCHSTANVSAGRAVGGLVGANEDSAIADCYSTGSVRGDNSVGGLAGSSDDTITNCYSTGEVEGPGADVGGLVGSGWAGYTARSFWDMQTSGKITSAGGIPKTTAEMQTMSTFTENGWDFVEIWGMGEHQTYPFLRTEAAGDLDHDNRVNLADLAILASHWLERVQ